MAVGDLLRRAGAGPRRPTVIESFVKPFPPTGVKYQIQECHRRFTAGVDTGR